MIAWLIMPLSFHIEINNYVFNSWRLFIVSLAFTSFSGGIALLYFPESPKFLLARGEKKQALQVLRYMFSKNTNKSTEEYPVILS